MATFYTNSILSFGDDDAVSDTYTYQAFPLGMYREEDGKGYRFAKRSDATIAITAGMCVYSLAPGTSMWTVTADVSDSHANNVVGIAVAAIADGSYGWLQTKGYHAAVVTDGADDNAAGDTVIAVGDGTTNIVAAGTASTHKIIGYATAADDDSANTVPVWICLE